MFNSLGSLNSAVILLALNLVYWKRQKPMLKYAKIDDFVSVPNEPQALYFDFLKLYLFPDQFIEAPFTQKI